LNINELARRLNLSISTVSRALNDAPDVSRETRERVKEVAAQYGYRANRLGRRLRRGKPETIGFLLTPPQRQFADPLYLEAIAGANEALNAYDLELSVTLARSQEDEIETLRRMVEAKAVDGVLLARTRRDDKRIAAKGGRVARGMERAGPRALERSDAAPDAPSREGGRKSVGTNLD
jgi:LacI family transcriptional regulator